MAHLAAPHFRAYKEGTPHMIKSLKPLSMQPLDPDHADGIFKKWMLKRPSAGGCRAGTHGAVDATESGPGRLFAMQRKPLSP